MGYLNCLKLINKAAGRKLSDAEHTALQERFNDAVKQLEPTVKDKAALYKQAAELAANKLKQDAMDYQATAHKYLAGHEMVKSGSLLQAVWHGTPHQWQPEPGFPHGRPRLDMIGTGEGAQAYGWGWYSAEENNVAKSYANMNGHRSWWSGGNQIDPKSLKGTEKKAFDIASMAITVGKNPMEYAAKLMDEGKISLRQYSAVSKFHDIKLKDPEGLGHIYKLDIPDNVKPYLLDWDKPLSEQTPEVRDALIKNGFVNAKADATMEGTFLYSGIKDKFGFTTDKEASEALAKIGIVGNRYLDGASRGKGEGSFNYVIWDQKTLDKIALLERNGEKLDAMREAEGKLAQGAKGSYEPAKNLIQLYKTADVTTVVHESAHQYFDTYAKIALDPNAPLSIKADTDTILHFLGVDSLSDWHSMSLDEQRPYHEKLATTFEQYMMEDKAPSALMNVFTKIKTWMLETYKSLTDVGVEPTPELREVFDKWSGQDIIPDRFKMGDFTPVETPRVASEVVDDPYVSEANRIVEEMPDMKIPLADINGNPLMDENGEPRMVSAKDHLEELHADRVASETNDAKFVTAALQCILGAA